MKRKEISVGEIEKALHSIVATTDTSKTETNTSRTITSPTKEDSHRRFKIVDGKMVEVFMTEDHSE